VSNLSDLLPAGASGKTIEAVATATIASKAPVILNSAGTVTEVVSSGETAVIPEGAVATFIAAPTGPPWSTATYLDSAFDVSSNKFVVVFRNAKNSDYLNYVVGTVSGSTITYGTVTTLNSATTVYPSVAADPSNSGTFVFGYNNFATAISYVRIGTLSGTTLTFGTAVQVVASNQNIVVEFDATSSTFVAVYNWSGGTPANSWYANACTYSGTTVTLGAQTQISASVIDDTGLRGVSFDPNTSGKFTAVAREAASPFAGWAICCTISGTTITAGTVQSFIATQAGHPDVAYDATTADTLSIIFSDVASSSYATAIAATLSGTVFTFGTKAVVVSSGSDTFNLMAPTGVAGTFQAVYRNDGSGDSPYSVAFTVSSSVVTGGTNTQISTDAQGANNYLTASMNPADTGGFVTAWNETAIDNASKAVYSQAGYTSSNLTATNFVGIADAGISTSATGTIVVQGGTVTGMSSLTTGGKYYVQNDGTLTSPNATEAYSINGATYDSVSFDVTQDSTITGMCFNGDGTKMYVCGEATDTIYQYSLSSAYDLSTASYDSVSLSVASQQGAPRSVVFNNDGSALYIVGTSAASVHQYTLTTPYDLSTGSYASKTVSVSTQELYPCGVIFNNDGASMYVVGSQNDTVYQYTLSTPFDVSTASYASKSMSVNSEQTSPTGLAFNSDGTKIFVIGETTPKINQYTLSSAYDISTGSYDSVSYTYSEGTVPRDIVWGNSGNKFYIPDSGPDDIYQYTPGGGASSSVNAGLAISTTALLLNGDS